MNELTIWQNIRQNASRVGKGITRIFLELYYVLKSPDTPFLDKTIIVSALTYQFIPKQILSKEKHGVLGYTDNIVTLMLAYNIVKRKVTPLIAMQVDRVLTQWFVYAVIK